MEAKSKRNDINELYKKAQESGDFGSEQFAEALYGYAISIARRRRMEMGSFGAAFDSVAEIEDTASETVLATIDGLKTGKQAPQNLRSWFATVVHNRLKDQFDSVACVDEFGEWKLKDTRTITLDEPTEDLRDTIEGDMLVFSRPNRVGDYLQEFSETATADQMQAFYLIFDYDPSIGWYSRTIEEGAQDYGMTLRTAKRLLKKVKEMAPRPPKPPSVPQKSVGILTLDDIKALVSKKN